MMNTILNALTLTITVLVGIFLLNQIDATRKLVNTALNKNG